MLHIHTVFKVHCAICKKTFQEENCYAYCTDCDVRRFTIDELHEAVKETSTEHSYIWEDKENEIGFDSEKERDIYLKGAKYGYKCALFWLCDFFGEVKFFENEIEDGFYQPHKKEF